MRWALVKSLSERGVFGSAEVDAEFQLDKTADGERHAAEAHALIPTADNKAKVWERLTRTELSNYIQRHTLLGVNRPIQQNLWAPYVDRYFAEVKDVWARYSYEIAKQFADLAFPRFAPSEENLKKCIRKATISGAFVPVINGTAFKNKGVQTLLDAVVDYLPSPKDIKEIPAIDLKSEQPIVINCDNKKFAGLAFKIMTDPFVGSLTFVRIYSGTLSGGSGVVNTTKNHAKERVGRILLMHANNREEVDEIRAGDIAACVGLKDVTTGETLCDPAAVVTLERMVFPEPVIRQAVEPKSKADQEKMGLALSRLAAEDPSFRVNTDEESGQTIIGGMGELHLEIIVDRMKREFGVEANVGKPQVAYRETIRKEVAESEGKFVRQSGGKGQYGHVVLKIEPQEPGKGFEFVDAIKGGVVPREYIPAVEKGVVEALGQGVLAGYPVVDVKVTLHFGSYHDVDSNELAFKMAAIFGFKEGCRKANPVILEPMMAVEVETPEDYAGNVMGDLSSRRGMVQGMDDMVGGGKAIKAEVPLSEMFGYSTTLRSMSQGRATYTMEFKHYAEAPRNVADAIIASRAK